MDGLRLKVYKSPQNVGIVTHTQPQFSFQQMEADSVHIPRFDPAHMLPSDLLVNLLLTMENWPFKDVFPIGN